MEGSNYTLPWGIRPFDLERRSGDGQLGVSPTDGGGAHELSGAKIKYKNNLSHNKICSSMNATNIIIDLLNNCYGFISL
jgi:hypothetical protein